MGSMSSSGSSGGMCAWCGGGTGEGGSSSSHMLLIQFCFRRVKNGEETVSRTAYHLPHQLLHFYLPVKNIIIVNGLCITCYSWTPPYTKKIEA